MAKKSEPQIIVENSDEAKERKAERFFSQFVNETDFVITIYKVGERGKAILVDKMENKIPDMLDVRNQFGGGTYKLYAHNFENPPKLIDSCVIHVADIVKSDNVHHVTDRKEIINELIQVKNLFAGTDTNAEILLKLMEIQNNTTRELSKMIADLQRQNTENLMRMEQRFTDILASSKQEKNSLSDIVEIMSFIDNIRGEKENSLLEKVLNNPIITSSALKLLENDNGHKKADNSVEAIIQRIPQDFKDELRTNPDKYKDIAKNELLKYVSPDMANQIISKILEH